MASGQSGAVYVAEMTCPTVRTYNLLPHLKILFKFLNCLGLTSVSFNRTTFERPRCRQKVTCWMYRFLQYYSGLLLFQLMLPTLGAYVKTSTYESLKSVEAQEGTISELTRCIHTTSIFVYATTYFQSQRSLLRLFNEALDIFNRLKARTGPELFLSSKLASVLGVKAVILAFIMHNVILLTLTVLVVVPYIQIDYSLFPVFNASMVFSYIYIQLTLLCFYEKMNDYLQTFGTHVNGHELKKCLREFMSISRRIHTLKQGLNSFAAAVFLCTYMGLFHDIEFTYHLLKTVIYSKYFFEYDARMYHLYFLYFPACLMYIFDMFFVGLLSDMLEKANEKFQAIVEKLAECTPSLQRDVEVMLMQDNICGLGFQTLGGIKVNQQFSFDFMFNVVMIFVITFLQFFAAEQIYTNNFVKLNYTVDFVDDL